MNDLGRYSRTYRFGDISYQSASDEAQAAVCKRMRMLYNGLTPEVSMQTTLVTRPIHESEIGNRTFFEVRDDPTGPLAEEYNDVLNAKMREGVSNLVRERYITFAVDAPDAEHAVPALARMRSMASGVLTGIRSDLSPLDGAERAGLL
ncbi:MAG: conjugal transfer protein TraC, partial [Eggerthella sp.]|nr:conjugal transfer protein TraC [Eggerthella sp.]